MIDWEVQADNGAYFIQLAPPAEAEPPQPSSSSCNLDLAEAKPHTEESSPTQEQPYGPSLLTHELPPAQLTPPPGQVTVSQPALLTSSGVFDIDAWLKENGWDFTAPSP